MKAMKKIFFSLLVFCLMTAIVPQPITVNASSQKLTFTAKTSGMGNTILVKKVKIDTDVHDGPYIGNISGSLSELEVKFLTPVSWKMTAKITSIKDNKGRSYKGYLTDKESDECDIIIPNLKYGRTYTIKINGIKKYGTAGSYRKLTLKVKLPAKSSGIIVKKAEYDADYEYYGVEHTVSFEFNKKISYKNSSYVLITDENGKSYSSKSSFVKWDDDECEVYLSEGLTIGKIYHYQIVDISAKGKNDFTTLTGSFVAYYN